MGAAQLPLIRGEGMGRQKPEGRKLGRIGVFAVPEYEAGRKTLPIKSLPYRWSKDEKGETISRENDDRREDKRAMINNIIAQKIKQPQQH